MMALAIKDLPARLEAFLAAKIGRPVRVSSATQLTGGASRDTWSIDAHSGDKPFRLIVRRDMGGEIMTDALDRAAEFAVLHRAYEGGVLVPRPRWVCMDAEVLGAPFFVMDRLEGESVGRRIVREPGLSEARKKLPAQMGEQLARIHAVKHDDLAFLPRPSNARFPAQSAIEQVRQQLASFGEPHPVLELAIRWLLARAPYCARTVLVHGDYRIGNMMVGAEGLVGVFDWEFAHVGDPAEDLAWPCVRSWRFGQDHLTLGGVGHSEEFFAAYEAASRTVVDRAAVRYWEVMGNLRWAVGCIAQAHRHLSGQVSSVELASLGRRTCEMELELLDLITASTP